MKKQFLLFITASLVCVSSLMAQDQGRMRQTPEEKTKAVMEKMAQFDLKSDVRIKAEAIFNDFFRAQQQYMKDARAAGNTDRSATMAKGQELTAERDNKLKQILTSEEYSKWINDIEPSLRPQRSAEGGPALKKAPVKAN